MSKIVPIIIGSIGVAAASYGGLVLFKGKGKGEVSDPDSKTTTLTSETPGGTGETGGGSGDANTRQTDQTSQPTTTLIFDSVEAFKKRAKDSDCIKDFLDNELTIDGKGDEFGDNKKPEEGKNFFKTNGEASETKKSCLIVNWTKSSAKDKGTGKFTWLWTFVKGDEGFVSFNVAEPSSEDGKLKFTGAFYLVEKESTKNKWEVKYKKEVTGDDKKSDSGTIDDFFPRATDDLKSQKEVGGEYGGFIDSKDKFGELCKKDSDDCKDNNPTTKKFLWKSKDSSDKHLKDGAKDLKGGEKIFDVKNHGDLEKQIKDLKGTWEFQSK